MNRINNSGWPALIGRHVMWEGITHLIHDAYGGIAHAEGHVLFRCTTKFCTIANDDVVITDEPVTCLRCLGQ